MSRRGIAEADDLVVMEEAGGRAWFRGPPEWICLATSLCADVGSVRRHSWMRKTETTATMMSTMMIELHATHRWV